MDTTFTNFPMLFWFGGSWYRITRAGILNDSAYVEIETPNPELEARLKQIIDTTHTWSGTYTLDMANRHQCFLSDYAAYQEWAASQPDAHT
jgi:hypothetical protein